jgi:hypothetical protein
MRSALRAVSVPVMDLVLIRSGQVLTSTPEIGPAAVEPPAVVTMGPLADAEIVRAHPSASVNELLTVTEKFVGSREMSTGTPPIESVAVPVGSVSVACRGNAKGWHPPGSRLTLPAGRRPMCWPRPTVVRRGRR